MKRNALALAFVGLLGMMGTASATLSVPNNSPAPGATAQTAAISYATRAGIQVANFAVIVTDAPDLIDDGSIRYQVFSPGGGGAFVDCTGATVPQADFITSITCSAAGIYTVAASAGDLPNQAGNMRVLYNVRGTATNGQTATIGFGPYCTGVQTPASNGCTAYFRTSDTLREDAPTAPVSTDGTVTVTVSADRTLAFNPVAGTTINFGPGAVGSTPSQNIVVTASGNVGTATVTGCGITGAGAASYALSATSLTFNAASANPQNLGVTCTIPVSNAAATLTCTQTDQGGAPTQRQWPLSCAPTPATPDVTATPAGGNVNVAGGAVGATAAGQVGFAATGGAGSGSATIACSVTGGAIQLSFGGAPAASVNQTVTGSAVPANLTFTTTLTNAAQPAAGTFQCIITDASAPGGETLNFTVGAPAGAVFTQPEFVPASSLWSQLALIAMFLGLGGVVLVVRRKG